MQPKSLDQLLTKYFSIDPAIVNEIFNHSDRNIFLADFQLMEMMLDFAPPPDCLNEPALKPKSDISHNQNHQLEVPVRDNLESTKSGRTGGSDPPGQEELLEDFQLAKQLSTQSDKTYENYDDPYGFDFEDDLEYQGEDATKKDVLNIYKTIMKSVTDEDVSDFDSKFLIEQTVNDMIIVQLFIHEQMDRQIKQMNEDNKGINVSCRTAFPSLAENPKPAQKSVYRKKKRKTKKTTNIYGQTVEVEEVYVPTWMQDKKGGDLTEEELKIFAEFGFEEDLMMDYEPAESINFFVNFQGTLYKI